MEEVEYLAYPIEVSNKALAFIHSHAMIAEFDDLDWIEQKIIEKSSKSSKFYYGGLDGIQFKKGNAAGVVDETEKMRIEVRELDFFITAFHTLLNDLGVHKRHLSSLLYISMFYKDYSYEASIQNNRNSHLKETGNFLLDLLKIPKTLKEGEDCLRAVYLSVNGDAVKNTPIPPNTQHDITSRLKQTIVQIDPTKLTDEENEHWEMYEAFYVKIEEHVQLSISKDLDFTIITETFKTFGDNETSSIKIPPQLREELVQFLVKRIFDEHKKFDTEIYKLIVTGNRLESDLRNEYNRNNRLDEENLIKSNLRIAIVINDYLQKFAPSLILERRLDLMFGFFAIQGLIPITRKNIKNKKSESKELELPSDYCKRIHFYKTECGKNNDTVRYWFKNSNTPLSIEK